MKMKLLSLKECILNKKVHVQTGPFGTQLKASEYTDSGVPVINVRNIGLGDIRPEKLEYISDYKADKLKAHFLKQGDIVFGRKGAVERHLFVKKEQEGWIQGSDCLRLRILTPEISAQFLSYYFQTQGHQDWMNNLCSFGATMTSLNQEIISRIEVPIPEIGVQLKIVDTLSAYDDLIEVNNQRIKLLEETARELYKEWFVRMRFPGWKETKLVKGVPEGWEVKKLGDVSNLITRGISPKYDENGNSLVLNQRCIRNNKIELEFARRQSKIIPNLKLLRKGDILINSTGEGTLGRTAQLNDDIENLSADSHLTIVRSKSNEAKEYLGMVIQSMEGYFETMAQGSTGQTELGRKVVSEAPITLPANNVLIDFSTIISPINEQVVVLSVQNTQLRQIRDRLLPRLISGKLSIKEP